MPLENTVDIFITDTTDTSIIELTKVDLIHSEEHRASYEITNFPLEDGSNRSDNIIKNPEELTLRGITSNVGVLDGTGSLGTLSRPHDAWSQIKKIADNKQQVTVVTILEVYENMSIELASVPQLNRDTGQNLNFELRLRQVPTVVVDDSTITPDKTASDNNPAKNMSDQVNNGDKQTDDNDVDDSILEQLL